MTVVAHRVRLRRYQAVGSWQQVVLLAALVRRLVHVRLIPGVRRQDVEERRRLLVSDRLLDPVEQVRVRLVRLGAAATTAGERALLRDDQRHNEHHREESDQHGEDSLFLAAEHGANVHVAPVDRRDQVADAAAETDHDRVDSEAALLLAVGAARVRQQRLARRQTRLTREVEHHGADDQEQRAEIVTDAAPSEDGAVQLLAVRNDEEREYESEAEAEDERPTSAVRAATSIAPSPDHRHREESDQRADAEHDAHVFFGQAGLQ